MDEAGGQGRRRRRSEPLRADHGHDTNHRTEPSHQPEPPPARPDRFHHVIPMTYRKESGPVDPLLLTPEQAAEALNISRATVYDLIRLRAITSVKIGRARRIPAHAV